MIEYELEAQIRKNLVCAYCGSKRQKVCWDCFEATISDLQDRITKLEKEIAKLKGE